MIPVMIRGFEYRGSGMLKSYFVEYILLTSLKFFFKKNGYMQSKVITSKLHPPHQFVSYSNKYYA